MVPSAAVGVSVSRIFGMPRICPVDASGSDTQTPALSRFTAGSHAVGGMPVSASQPLVRIAIPPLATVSTPDQILRSQPVPALPPSGPVPSYQRIEPSGYRWLRVLTEDQAAYPSEPAAPRGSSATGGSAAMPVLTPARYWSNHR